MSKVQRKIGTVFTIAMICVAMVTAKWQTGFKKIEFTSV